MSDEKLRKINKWRKDGKYLPEFMRDFHNQKDLFKWLHSIIFKNNQKVKDFERLDISFRDMHVYTIDYFLWFMAQHGYTLQKTRTKIDFYDIEETIKEYTDESRKQSISVLKAMSNQNPETNANDFPSVDDEPSVDC